MSKVIRSSANNQEQDIQIEIANLVLQDNILSSKTTNNTYKSKKEEPSSYAAVISKIETTNDNSNPQQGNKYSQQVSLSVNDGKKLFIGGLPNILTDAEFLEYFQHFGKVIDSVIMYDRETNRSRGFGFVTFENADVALSVLSMAKKSNNKLTIKGRPCEVKVAYPKPVYQQNSQTSQNTRRIRCDLQTTSSNASLQPSFGSCVYYNPPVTSFNENEYSTTPSFEVGSAPPHFYPATIEYEQPPNCMPVIQDHTNLTHSMYCPPYPLYYGYDTSTTMYPVNGNHFADGYNFYEYPMFPPQSVPMVEFSTRSTSSFTDLSVDHRSTSTTKVSSDLEATTAVKSRLEGQFPATSGMKVPNIDAV